MRVVRCVMCVVRDCFLLFAGKCCCSLRLASCALLPVRRCAPFAAGCLLFVARCLLAVVCCMRFIVCWRSLCGVRCLTIVVGRCSLFVVRSVLLVVLRSLVLVGWCAVCAVWCVCFCLLCDVV